MDWISVDIKMPDDYIAVLTQHEDDLYPVAAYRMGGEWLRETEGPEDAFYKGGRHQPLYRAPTHWRDLPCSPRVCREALD